MNRYTKFQRFLRNLKARHIYNKRTGLYKFLIENIIKLIFVFGAIIGLLFLLNYLFDLESIIQKFIYTQKTYVVLIAFYISESILGWIPPDFFIVWAEKFENPFVWVTLLATISYLGGINSYWIGKALRRFKKINNYIKSRNEKYFKMIKKWGGIIIIFAAIFPLPFATTGTVAGMVNYSFKKFLIYGLSRYIRFFLYASVIFKTLSHLFD